jgi:predicted dehydrogenase
MTMSANRRDFLKSSAALAAGAALTTAVNRAYAGGSDVIKVGVIGCGGRGSGAAEDCLKGSKETKIVALGDVYKQHALDLRKLLGKFGDRVELPDDRIFDGLQSYEQVLGAGIDLVILATPPGFRPGHLEAAVTAGKHIFTEKPVAVDGPGIRKVLAAAEEATRKNLAVVAGTQRRHQTGYLETMKHIHDGAIGEILAAHCYWNNAGIWFRNRKTGMSDAEYQINNWYHFLWTCGDHIVEQHVHNLDVINWAMQGHPISCWAMGGRSARKVGPPNEVGNIFDHFAVEYTFDKGVVSNSFCQHIPGADNVSEFLIGTKGHCQVNEYLINGKRVLQGKDNAPYVQEHTDLVASIKAGQPLNELRQVAESTMTAIMGRTAAYTGKVVTWDEMLKSEVDTFPAKLTWDMSLQVSPTPVPGRTKRV